jgi:hypothetical protein
MGQLRWIGRNIPELILGCLVVLMALPVVLVAACVATAEIDKRSVDRQLEQFVFSEEFILDRSDCGFRYGLFGPCGRVVQSPAFGSQVERMEFYRSRAVAEGWRCYDISSFECRKGDRELRIQFAMEGAVSPCDLDRRPNCADYITIEGF